MKKQILGFLVAFVGLAASAQAQTHVPFGAIATLQFGPATNEAAAQVDRYEARQDAGQVFNTAVTIPAADYAFQFPVEWRNLVGTHIVEVRACRVATQAACGPWQSVSYIQDPQILPVPGSPTNPRVTVPPGAVGIAVNGTIDRPPFKEKGLDVVSIRPDDGVGSLLVGASGLRAVGGSYTVRVGDNAGVVVWRPVQ